MKRNQLKLKGSLMRKLLPAALILLSFSSCKKTERDPRIVLDTDYKDEILAGRDAMRVYLISNAPGASVSVSIDGKTVWSEGLGFANKELQAPARPETKYRIGRTSQMFTGMLIAKLQEEGKLDVNKSFYDYVPNYPKKQYDFTPLNLGTYTAGFPESDENELLRHSEIKSLKEYIKSAAEDTLAYPPNKYFAINDYGTCLLGIMAENIGQKSYAKLVKETLLDTLGLDETTLDLPAYLIDNRATPYHLNFIAQLINAPEVNQLFMAPAYGYLSTADDLNKVGQLLLKKEFFSKESYDLFFTRQKLDNGFETNFGFLWNVYKDFAGRTVYVQEGSTIGGSSFLAIFPEQKLVISICTNIKNTSESLPSGKIAKIFLDRIDPQEAEKQAPPKAE